MKKITLLAILALGFSFTSCKKDRTCTCTDTVTVTSSLINFTDTDASTTTLKEVNGKSARANCLSYEATQTENDGNGGIATVVYKSTCSLD